MINARISGPSPLGLRISASSTDERYIAWQVEFLQVVERISRTQATFALADVLRAVPLPDGLKEIDAKGLMQRAVVFGYCEREQGRPHRGSRGWRSKLFRGEWTGTEEGDGV